MIRTAPFKQFYLFFTTISTDLHTKIEPAKYHDVFKQINK